MRKKHPWNQFPSRIAQPLGMIALPIHKCFILLFQEKELSMPCILFIDLEDKPASNETPFMASWNDDLEYEEGIDDLDDDDEDFLDDDEVFDDEDEDDEDFDDFDEDDESDDYDDFDDIDVDQDEDDF